MTVLTDTPPSEKVLSDSGGGYGATWVRRDIGKRFSVTNAIAGKLNANVQKLTQSTILPVQVIPKSLR